MKKIFDDSLWSMLMVFAVFAAIFEHNPKKEETLGKKISLYLLMFVNSLLFFTMV